MSTFIPRVSKLPIIPVTRESLLTSIIHFEKSNIHFDVLSLKDICTRRLLLSFGDDHSIYERYLSSKLRSYVTYDYFIETNNCPLKENNANQWNEHSKYLCCRDCSIKNLGASKCRRRKCFAYRLREIFKKLSQEIIPWNEQQNFSILENDDEEDNPIVFLYLKSRHSKKWIKEQFYLLDLLRVLHINIFRE